MFQYIFQNNKVIKITSKNIVTNSPSLEITDTQIAHYI